MSERAAMHMVTGGMMSALHYILALILILGMLDIDRLKACNLLYRIMLYHFYRPLYSPHVNIACLLKSIMATDLGPSMRSCLDGSDAEARDTSEFVPRDCQDVCDWVQRRLRMI